jgi:peptide/nickel transport system permease protein
MTSPAPNNDYGVLSIKEVARLLVRSKAGLAGALILLSLILLSIYAAVAVPLEYYKQWNNPIFWQDYPKTAAPAWTNTDGGLVKHTTLTASEAQKSETNDQGIRSVTYSWKINFNYDSYPTDFILSSTANYSQQPILQLDVFRPDGKDFRIYYSTLPATQGMEFTTFTKRITSSDQLVQSNLQNYLGEFKCEQDPSKPTVMLFSNLQNCSVLKGTYTVTETMYFFTNSDTLEDSKFVVGGQVYGLMGTDDQGRDLSVGILWGAPVALFIGLTVAIASTFIGLFYGVFAGYKGRYTDEGMMRANDIFYSLPVLPLLIILSVSIGRSIFLFVGFLVLFGWVGMAKIGRSLALQIKNLQYVEAAELMGESGIKIIIKHIIPQLLPIAFASIAIAVPAAILGEAALSFLGLGDPSIPTWGRILHDANSAGAIARGIWWWTMIPGFMIALTGIAFILIGNSLNSVLNIKSRVRAQ